MVPIKNVAPEKGDQEWNTWRDAEELVGGGNSTWLRTVVGELLEIAPNIEPCVGPPQSGCEKSVPPSNTARSLQALLEAGQGSC